jgi:GNAT superfamily N-acetyltransferase
MPDQRIRAITPDDVPAVVGLVYELAEYERLVELCHLTNEQLAAALFGTTPALFGLVAVDQQVVVGYALYFLNFSTWEGVHGIYLEDLYVRPDRRGSGLGRALLTSLAGIANDRGYARVEWSVLDWNAPSIAFYRSLGAEPMDGWTVFRLDGPALRRAAEVPAAGQTATQQKATQQKAVEIC